jgi:hypothetical protein
MGVVQAAAAGSRQQVTRNRQAVAGRRQQVARQGAPAARSPRPSPPPWIDSRSLPTIPARAFLQEGKEFKGPVGAAVAARLALRKLLFQGLTKLARQQKQDLDMASKSLIKVGDSAGPSLVPWC